MVARSTHHTSLSRAELYLSSGSDFFRLAILLGFLGAFLLSWTIDGHLDGDFATLNIFAVHLRHGFLLLFLRCKRYKSETTTLSRLVACLELLDHEAGNGSKGDFGRGWFICREEFLELVQTLEMAV